MTASSDVFRLDPDAIRANAAQLGLLFVDAVDDGASLGFLGDLTPQAAAAYWTEVAARDDDRVVLAARDAEGIAGCVMLVPAGAAFQPHRADIFKLAVHRRARGRGIAARLMDEAEGHALRAGRWMLTLMTRRGCDAEHLYRKLGWSLAGILPDDSVTPRGQLCDAAIYFKRLR